MFQWISSGIFLWNFTFVISGVKYFAPILVGPCFAEQPHHLQVPGLSRKDQGNCAILVRLILVGPSLTEQPHHVQVPGLRRKD